MRGAPAQRLHALDALRLLAALAVVLHHFGWVATPEVKALPYYPAQVARYGYLGVEFFFLISGFVILMSAQGASARSFVVARAVRLLPAFWICCTLTFLVAQVDPLGPDIWTWAANLTMLPRLAGAQQMDGAYWTLVLELQFYAGVAIVLLAGRLHHAERLLWCWLAASVLAGGPVRTMLFADFAPWFIGGCACFLLRERRSALRWALFFAAMAAALPGVQQRAQQQTLAHGFAYEPALLACVVGVFFALILAVALGRLRLPAWRWLAVAGATSYPLYLLHMRIGYQVIWTLQEALPVASYFVALTLVLLLAMAVAMTLEPHLKRRLRAFLAG